MPHAFQHRPPPTAPNPELFREQGWAHGFCYIAPQRKLWFGYDRREPVESRPVVSALREDDQYYVLPGTQRFSPTHFRLTPQDYLTKKARPDAHDTYLSHRYEPLGRSDLKEIGVLHHPVRINLMQWLKKELAKQR